MKQLKNFLIKREQSQARLSFAKREKSRLLAKTLLTLVALLALTNGAWADTWNSGACTVTLSDDVMTVSGTGAMANYEDENGLPWYGNSPEIKTIVIESGVTSIGNFAFASLSNLESVSIPASVTSIGTGAFRSSGSDASALTVSFAEGSAPLTIGEIAFSFANLKSIDIPNRVTSIGNYAFEYCSHLESVSIPASVTSIGEGAFSNCGMLAKVSIYAPSLTTYGNMAFQDNASGRKIHVLSDAVDTYKAGWPDYAADFVGDLQPLASGPKVAWDKAKNSGSFKMPGGNVTLEPEYYPQATVADGGVTAADADARATTDDPLVKVDATKLTGAKKLMYFVSNSGTTAPAYDAEGWTDQLPTAEGFTQQGIVYVWYYPVGTDEGVDGATATYSDGDIFKQSITARIAAAPTYAVTFAEGTEESDKWTASPAADVKKGQTVTVTYTGTKKVIGVKAEKKEAESLIVNPVVGQIIGSDGKNYDANATLPDGVTKVAMIAYVSGSNGLALALTDIDLLTWDNSSSYNEGKTAPEVCSAWNTSKPVTGGTWKLPSQDEWKQMFSANGGNEGSYTGLNTAIGNAGGTALMENQEYWSSSEVNEYYAWFVKLADGNASWDTDGKHYARIVRACLAF